MPKVQASIVIERSIEEVYALAKNIEAFPEFMPDVEEVRILESGADGRQVSSWVGVLKEFRRTIKWTEEDYWDDDRYAASFRQTEGDFDSYSGIWEFRALSDTRTEAQLHVEYEYDVPLIGSLIRGLLQRKMQENSEKMLAAIKAQAESTAQAV